jgi:hypothetical protein
MNHFSVGLVITVITGIILAITVRSHGCLPILHTPVYVSPLALLLLRNRVSLTIRSHATPYLNSALLLSCHGVPSICRRQGLQVQEPSDPA